MDEEAFKTSVRKFLKKVGVTSQQEIEKALQAAEDQGRLDGGTLPLKMTLECPQLELTHEIEGELKLK